MSKAAKDLKRRSQEFLADAESAPSFSGHAKQKGPPRRGPSQESGFPGSPREHRKARQQSQERFDDELRTPPDHSGSDTQGVWSAWGHDDMEPRGSYMLQQLQKAQNDWEVMQTCPTFVILLRSYAHSLRISVS